MVPHSDNILADSQFVASQPQRLCPLLEYNGGQSNSKMSFRTSTLVPRREILTMPDEPGLGPDVDRQKCKRV